jgi:protein-S-isoprenylcysteine O-methyltransferase Ste14
VAEAGRAAFLAAFAAWGVLELALILRDGTVVGSDTDRSTRQVMFLSISAAVLVALGVSQLPLLRLPAADLLAGIGGIIIAAGVALRLWAVVVLGRYFRLTVTVEKDQPVVTTGPYRVLRHPSYAGMLVTLVGLGIGLGSVLSLAAACVIAIPAMLRRINVEERALRAGLGAPYDRYCDSTWRILPGLW